MLKSALYLTPSYSICDMCKINQATYSFTQTQGLKIKSAHICEQ